jgi:ubiquinone/menaquinone biosynthesis C-methylase UbiE
MLSTIAALLTIGLLAIVAFKALVKKYLPRFLNFTMKMVHGQIKSVKEQLFKEAFDNVKSSNRNSGQRLEILELGIGTGENFKLFPQNSNVTVLDKTDIFLPYLHESMKRNKREDLRISKLVVNNAENMHSIESDSIDAVVHTFTLCSIEHADLALKEIYRVLKPGGVCVFTEHAADNENPLRRILQTLVDPLLGDCCFKDIKKLLENAPYDTLMVKKVNKFTRFLTLINPLVYGYALKKLN